MVVIKKAVTTEVTTNMQYAAKLRNTLKDYVT